MTTSTTFKPLVLITGANQGLGYAAAQNLASTNNYRVLIGSRSLAKAEDAIRQLRAEAANKIDGSTLVPVVLDVANDDSIAAAAKSISDKFGSLDILINNAGIATSPDTNVSLRDDYHAVFGTNVFGVAVIIDCFLPLLRASSYHDRRIVNVTSGLGQMGVAYSTVSHYSAKAFALPIYRSSKAALNMLTAVTRRRWLMRIFWSSRPRRGIVVQPSRHMASRRQARARKNLCMLRPRATQRACMARSWGQNWSARSAGSTPAGIEPGHSKELERSKRLYGTIGGGRIGVREWLATVEQASRRGS